MQAKDDQLNLSALDLPEKERKILESAVKAFSEKGFSATTTSEIAKGAGVAEGTIFRYFKTKKDILRGIMIQMINLLSSKLVIGSIEKIFAESDEKDLKQILKELLYDRFRLAESIFPMARIVITEALYHEDVREAFYQNIMTRAIDMFKAFHAKMVARGLMRNDVEPAVLFRTIFANIFILIAQKKLTQGKKEEIDLEAEFDKMIDVLLNGISRGRQ